MSSITRENGQGLDHESCRRMRRVLLTAPYFYPRTGGLEEYALRIGAGLVNLGWDVTVATSGESDDSERVGELTVHRLPAETHLFNTPIGIRWPRRLRLLIERLQPSVINAHAPVPSMALATLAASGGYPVVLTYHAGSMRKESAVPDVINAGYERFAIPWMMKRSDWVICSSSFVRDGLLARWSDKVRVVTPGVDAGLFVPAGAWAPSRTLLAVGDFRGSRKGLDYLLGAMKLVPSAELRLVGMAPIRAQDRVTFTGPLGREAVASEMQRAAALVLPSVSDESFGMVLVEAMACGIPVIASDIGGIPTVVDHGKNGLLVPPRDARALADAIQRVLDNPAFAQRLGAEGRRRAVGDYAWSSRVKATEQTLVSAVGGVPLPQQR